MTVPPPSTHHPRALSTFATTAASSPTSTARCDTAAPFDEHYGMWIDGRVRNGEARIAVENPATEGILCHVAEAAATDVGDAVSAASRAYTSGVWARASVQHRAHVLHEGARLLREAVPRIAELEALQVCVCVCACGRVSEDGCVGAGAGVGVCMTYHNSNDNGNFWVCVRVSEDGCVARCGCGCMPDVSQ